MHSEVRGCNNDVCCMNSIEGVVAVRALVHGSACRHEDSPGSPFDK